MKQTLVLITGHSQGLGAALAEAWLKKGAQVIGISRGDNETLQAKYPTQLREISLDLADPRAVGQWLDSVDWSSWCTEQSVLWLFNNAGTVSPSVVLGKQGSEAIANAVALNVTTPLMLADAIAAQRAPSLICKVVHISSGAAQKPYPGWSIYGACKAALDQHARNAHAERNGIDVVSIAPGIVDTAMQAQLRNNEHFPNRDRFVGLHSNNQLQSPTETAARIVQFCCSERFAKQAVVDLRELDV